MVVKGEFHLSDAVLEFVQGLSDVLGEPGIVFEERNISLLPRDLPVQSDFVEDEPLVHFGHHVMDFVIDQFPLHLVLSKVEDRNAFDDSRLVKSN